jgi:hypothetical protein
VSPNPVHLCLRGYKGRHRPFLYRIDPGNDPTRSAWRALNAWPGSQSSTAVRLPCHPDGASPHSGGPALLARRTRPDHGRNFRDPGPLRTLRCLPRISGGLSRRSHRISLGSGLGDGLLGPGLGLAGRSRDILGRRAGGNSSSPVLSRSVRVPTPPCSTSPASNSAKRPSSAAGSADPAPLAPSPREAPP